MTKFGRTGSTVVVILITAALVFGGGVWFGRQQTQAAFQSPAQVAQTRPTSAQTGHEEMDAAHEARVKAFPAKTQGLAVGLGFIFFGRTACRFDRSRTATPV